MKKKIISLSSLLIALFCVLFLSGCQKFYDENGKEVATKSGYYLEPEYTLVYEGTPLTIEPKYYGEEKNESKYEVSMSQESFDKQGIYYVTTEVKKGSKVVDTFRSVVTVDYPSNAEFAEYEQEMFVYFMEGDQIAINIFFEDYEAYGLEHDDEASWYSYSKYTQEEFDSDQEEIQRLRTECDAFKNAQLSYDQQVTYSVISKNINYYEVYLADIENVLMNLTYVEQFGGYCANLPSELEAFELRTKQDVEDYIKIIDSVYDAFMSYVQHMKDRESAGYPLSKETLESFVEYLDGVVKKGNDYYLVKVGKDKLKGAQIKGVITEEELAAYNVAYDAAMANCLKAHADLKTETESYIKKCTLFNVFKNMKTGYLQTYEGGKELYEAILRNRLGMFDMTMDEYIAYLDSALTRYMKLYRGVSSKVTEQGELITNGKVSIASADDPQTLIAYLKEFAKTIVPELEQEPVITVKEMDETETENTTTAAYYMKSALDSSDVEYIHLNMKSLGTNKLETIKTMAHEGYPGHLYEYVYTKENEHISNLVKINTCTGHGEGWAKYVEYALSEYIIAQNGGSDDWKYALQTESYWDLYAYCLYARIDVGVNYQGWTSDNIESFMKKQGLNSSSAKSIYDMMIEIPGQYAPYGYGFSVVYELHEEAKATLGEFYSEIDFNAALIEHGWLGLDDTQKYARQYIENVKFLNAIGE